MTQAEKLEALVHKAIDGGFDLELNTGYATWIIVGTNIRVANRQSENYVSKSHYDMHSYQLIFSHAFARALFGEEKKEWLGKYSWYSLYEQDGYTFKDAQELLDSWIYQGGGPKPTTVELEELPKEGVKASGGMIEKLIETTNKGLKYHLQQAVISDDPIDYMYQVLIDSDFPMKEGVDYV